jgi:predicted secreted Zn-dependent protease
METMSEDHMPYNENLATMLEAVDKRLHAITTDPSTSHWLKRAVLELWEHYQAGISFSIS